MRAYQLTNKFDGVNKAKQNGIIFYVPAWDTSKIDPVTGFVDLLKPKYTSVREAKSYLKQSMISNITQTPICLSSVLIMVNSRDAIQISKNLDCLH